MGMIENNGGMAFPSEEPSFAERSDLFGYNPGMTLRDYFAAQMLCSVFGAQTRTHPEPKRIAEAAYAIADAMIEARNRE